MKELKIYCDAGSFNNGYKDPNKPMFGSYGCLIVRPSDNKILYEFKDWFDDITNNQGELFGFIKAYTEFLKRYKSKEKYHIEVISDSQYLINGVNKYLNNWKKNRWRNSTGDVIKNKDMWLIIDKLLICESNISFTFTWQRGHRGKKVTLEEDPNIYFNEICDSLATEQINFCASDKNTLIHPFLEDVLNDIAKSLKIKIR